MGGLIESRPTNDLLSRVRDIVISPRLDEQSFQLIGATAAEAILREDVGVLDTLCEGLDAKLRNPHLRDEDKKLRLQGNMLVVAGGASMIRQLRANSINWPDRGSNIIALRQATEDILAGTPKYSVVTITRVIPDAIQSFDEAYLQIVHGQLERFTLPDVPQGLRFPMLGMLDVVRPALERTRRN